MNLFDWDKPLLKIDKPVRLIELFGGIGAQAKALERLGVPFEHYRMVEIDRYAVASYNAVHGTDFTPTDICAVHAEDLGIVDTDRYEYILTYSFPCTDLSRAGKGEGMSRGSGTRSGLLWEVERILGECKELPQVLLMENVAEVVSDRHMPDFSNWCAFLESLGYTNEWQVLNARDFGVPQNRIRCYMVSFLGEYAYEFPKAIPLERKMKDLLEPKVDERYYISDEATEQLCSQIVQVERERERERGIARSASRRSEHLRNETRLGFGCSSSKERYGGEIEVARALTARDCKGMPQTQQWKAVVEIKRKGE